MAERFRQTQHHEDLDFKAQIVEEINNYDEDAKKSVGKVGGIKASIIHEKSSLCEYLDKMSRVGGRSDDSTLW